MNDTDLQREVDIAEIWVRRFLEIEEKMQQAERRVSNIGQWLRATETFVLEKRELGEHRSVRDAVAAFQKEKGYGLPPYF